MSRPLSFRLAQGTGMVALLLAVLSLPAWGRSYNVSKFNSNIHVESDGSIRVEEQITFKFIGSYSGVYRNIPVDYPGPSGSNYSLFLKVERITDESGTPLKFEQKTRDGFLKLKIYVPGANDASRTVNIEYTVPDAIKFFDSHDEFYWNVTGSDWVVPIDYASATVYFPAAAAGSLRVQAFSGAYGSKDRARSSVEGAVAVFETLDPLSMRGGLTIDVSIEKGILRQPSSFARMGWYLRSNPVTSLPFYAFAVMFLLWWVKGRDPDPGISVAPMYEPPEKISPAEAGTLVAEGVEPRDITAILVDLAVRGYVKIVESDHKGLLFNTKDYELHLLKEQKEWINLTDFEQTMLSNIFTSGSVVRLSDLRNHFYQALPGIKNGVIAALKEKGMYTVDPESASGYFVAGAVLVFGPYALMQWLKWFDFLNGQVPAIVCGVIAGVIVFLFGRQMTATSLKGARTRVQVQGFQEFMNRVDAERLKTMPPDTFEKYLPYAMALGVEHRWAKAFEGIAHDQPAWYQSSSGGAFNSFYFMNSLSAMSQQASSAFVAAPRSSSSSSGFGGGGGFSGGGFGGGGGGAF